MKDKIKDPIRRTQAYWYVDGLWEIGFGGLFFLLGIMLILESLVPNESAILGMLRAVRHTILIAGPFGILAAVRFTKSNLTYLRTGYLAYKQPRGKQLVKIIAQGIGITAFLGTVVILIFWLVPAMQGILIHLPAWLTFGLGAFIGAMFLSWGLRTGIPRFFVLAVLAIITGAILGWYSRDLNIITGKAFLLTGPGIFFAILGLSLTVSGIATLRDYLKRTQPVEGGSDER